MEKTIKQLADEYGISKQAIRKRINQLPTSCYRVTTNQLILVNDEGLKLLDLKLSTKVSTKVPTVDTTELIAELRAEKERMQKEIDEKNQQISNLIQLANQAQQLQAIAESKLKLLEDQEANQTNKRHWFFKGSRT